MTLLKDILGEESGLVGITESGLRVRLGAPELKVKVGRKDGAIDVMQLVITFAERRDGKYYQIGEKVSQHIIEGIEAEAVPYAVYPQK